MPNSSLTVDRLVWLSTDCWKHCGRLPALRMEGLRATAEPKSTVRLVGDEHWCISSLIRAVFYVAPRGTVQSAGAGTNVSTGPWAGIEVEGCHPTLVP